MKYLISFLLLLIFLISPVSAEIVDVPDSAGSNRYSFVNEKYSSFDVSDFIDFSDILEFDSEQIGIDRYSTEADTFVLSSDDYIDSIEFRIFVSSSSANETMPISLGNGSEYENLYININNTKTGAGLLSNINVSVYSADGYLLAFDNGLCLFSEYFEVYINRFGVGVTTRDFDYGLYVANEIPFGSFVPVKSISTNIADSNNGILVRLQIYDNQEYAEEKDSSFLMGVYWVIESIIGDPDNVLYAYFQVADLYFNWVTGIIVLMVTAPFMYVFFALVCGLFSCILKGSFSGGVSAGISTFIKIMKIPVHIFKMVGSFIYGIIKILKPVG